MSLAYGLVWCRSCQVRTALKDAGGKCPVCDPSQGNRVSANAGAELERIDQVLAGADTYGGDAAQWSADGSHQDPDVLDWQRAFLNRRVVRGRSVRIAPANPDLSHPPGGWSQLGFLTSEVFTIDETHDPGLSFTEWPASGTLTVELVGVPDDFVRVFLGAFGYTRVPDRHELARWEDDGGPIVATYGE